MRKVKPRIEKRTMYEPDVAKSNVKTKKVKIYPSVSIPLSALPEAKEWSVDEEYVVTLKLDMKSIRFADKSEEQNSIQSDYDNRADFNIVGIEVEGDKKAKSKNKVSSRYSEEEDEEYEDEDYE